MSRPIHALKHEHRVIEQGLRALDGVCLRLASGHQVSPEALSQVVDFIRAFAVRYHHGKEEAHLFPILERRNVVRAGGPLDVLTYQHEIECGLADQLSLAAQKYSEGDLEARGRFVTAAGRYTELMVGHMEREDQILFRLAEEVLDETDKAELTRAFEHAATEFGAGSLEKYERLAAELERAWAA